MLCVSKGKVFMVMPQENAVKERIRKLRENGKIMEELIKIRKLRSKGM